MKYTEKDIFQTEEDYLNRKEEHILVVDIDETIVNISPKMYYILKANQDFFKDYLDLDNNYTVEEILNRPVFGMEEWLAKEEYKGGKLPQEIKDKFYSLFDDENFYDDLDLTLFGLSLKEIAKQSFCKKIYIVSHCVGDKQFNSKIKLLKREYSFSSKFEFIAVPMDKKKSDSIVENEIKWTTFADDNIDVICDVIENTISFGQEILVPRLGYNNETEELLKLIDKYNIQFFYFNFDKTHM